jgi:FkbM family methyltransferase
MRVFLDVGAHDGETLSVVRAPRFGFERIVCVEPSTACATHIRSMAVGDERIEVVAAGLWSSNQRRVLSGSGGVGASVLNDNADGETVELIDAAEFWDAHVRAGDEVWLKMNIEGAEHEVIRRWLERPGIARLAADVHRAVVHVDTDKVAGMADASGETRRWLRELGWDDASRVFVGRDVTEKTRNWLLRTEGSCLERWQSSWGAPVEHALRRRLFLVRKRLGLLPGRR